MGNKKNVIIYGIGQQAEVVHYYFQNNLKRKVEAFAIDFESDVKRKKKLPVIQLNDLERNFEKSNVEIFIAIGGIGLNIIRQYFFEKIKRMGFIVANCISVDNKIPSNLKIGENCFIDDHSRINPFTVVGDNYLTIDTAVGHHSVIGKNVTTMGAILGANVTIGDNCFIGIGAKINSGVIIGEFSLIDIGSIVKKDVPPYSVVSSDASVLRNIDARRVKLLGISYDEFSKIKKL